MLKILLASAVKIAHSYILRTTHLRASIIQVRLMSVDPYNIMAPLSYLIGGKRSGREDTWLSVSRGGYCCILL